MPRPVRHRSRRQPISFGLSRGLLARILIGCVLSAAAILLTVSVSAAALLRDALPEVALRWAPYDARAAARLAEIKMTTRAGPAARAQALARSALQRDPTVASAWRTLGLVAATSGQQEQATRLVMFAHDLSRRDLATQLWLIEDSVRRNDVRGALRHYDFALRTSRQAADLLLPTLVSAISEPSINPVVADLLLTNPPWRPAFFYALSQNVSSGESAAKLLERLRSKGYLEPIPNAAEVPARLVEQGDYSAAYRVYTALQMGSEGIKANDQFAKSSKLLPFDWDLAALSDIRAEPQLMQATDRSAALYVYAVDGAIGIAAKRLMVLPPGTYRFASLAHSVAGSKPERLEWALRCAGDDNSLLRLDLRAAKDTPSASTRAFTVPAQGCRAQWVELSVRAPDGSEASEVWIQDVKIEPAGAGSPASAAAKTRYAE